MRGSGHVVVCTCVKRWLYAQEETLRSLARKVSWLQLQNEGTTKKMPIREPVG